MNRALVLLTDEILGIFARQDLSIPNQAFNSRTTNTLPATVSSAEG